MRLETKVTVLKKLKPKYYYGFDDDETKILRSTVQSIDMAWSSYAYDITEETHVLWIGSSDLDRVKFSLEQRKIVKKALEGKLKRDFTHNPSKPKSDMEYRKRAYYGKCKR